MAFFDKFGETISTKSKEVAKKAKEIAEVSSLNGQISSQEDLIHKSYTEIGKKYFSLNKDIEDPEFVPQINTIKVALEKIESLKKNIQLIKGVQQCQSCNAEVSLESAFCSNCGAKVEKEVVEEVIEVEVVESSISCNNCGTQLEASTAFCTHCGHKVQE